MGPFKVLKTVLHQADFFSTTQMLRYREQAQFRTLTGGIFSIAIIVIVSFMFISDFLSTINRQQIIWTSSTNKQPVPLPLTVNFNTFVFGIQLYALNLSDTPRYFDIVLTSSTWDEDTGETDINIPLETCTRDMFNINDQIVQDFDRMDGSSWLCPPANASVTLQGKYSSEVQTQLLVSIYACGTQYENQTCANQSAIDDYLSQDGQLLVYFVNPIINPNNLNPVEYYLQDQNFINFNQQLGAYGNLYISDYSIFTDYSLMPITNQQSINGGIIQKQADLYATMVSDGWYSSFVFCKGGNAVSYDRSFKKFDTVVSYVGGLFGAIVGLMFVMNFYTKLCFEITLAAQIFEGEDNKRINIQRFNIFRSFAYSIYMLFRLVGKKLQWKTMKDYDSCRQQVKHQLDVKLLLQRISFLERAAYFSLGQHRFKGLHLHPKATIKETKDWRELYYLRSGVATARKKREDEKAKRQGEDKISMKQENEKPTLFFKNGQVFPLDVYSQSEEIQRSQKVSVQQKKAIIRIGNGQRLSYGMKNADQSQMSDSQMETVKASERQSQSVPSSYDFELDAELSRDLRQLKYEGLRGDPISKAVWEGVDSEIKKILQRWDLENEEEIQK